MHTEYRWVLAEAEANPDVRVVVVTGAGRGFCAGADTGALEKHAEAGAYDAGVVADQLANPGYGVRPEYDHAFAFHFGMAKPVVAAVNGPAAGVGMVLACFCDVRFAAASSKFTTSAPRLGLPAEYGLSWVLPRLVGTGHAADLLLSSRMMLADEAERIGLVNRVLPDDELMPFSLGYAAPHGGRGLAVVAARGQAPALRRPPPGCGLGRRRVGGVAGADGHGGGLRRGGGGVVGQAPAALQPTAPAALSALTSSGE